MRSHLRRAAVLVGCLTALAACGGTDNSSDAPDASADVTSPQSGSSFNATDVMFAQMMIPHHEQALELSAIALDPTVGAGAAVVDLATRIRDGQSPEIDEMTSLLNGWGEPVTPADGSDHSSMMNGMLSTDELNALRALRGAEFDRAWLEAMIAHHDGAVLMAEDVIAIGISAETRALGERIIAAQQAEMTEMRTLLGG